MDPPNKHEVIYGDGHGEEGEEEDGDVEKAEVFGRKKIGRCGSDRNNTSTSYYSYSRPLLTKRTNTSSQIAIVGANTYPIESLDYV